MRYSSEQAFSLLMSSLKYFTPFNWSSKIVNGMIYNNVAKNRLYVSRKRLFLTMVSMYESRDVNYLAYGYCLSNKTMLNISSVDWSKCIHKWLSIKNKLHNTIKNYFINEKYVINNNIYDFTSDSMEEIRRIIYEIGYVEASIKILERGWYNEIKKISQENRLLSDNEIYEELFRHLQLLKLISKE